ncbi:MAG: RNA-binding S4 domain-containing protein [Alphaproteobacteria bacterium]|nr:RNA-binding S4 domain-containing protein [Alphaproteobacteria bacterium]
MTSPSIRLDKWLWFARFCKTRGQAQALIEAGQVSVDGVVVSKTAHGVRVGQSIAVALGPVRRTVKVEAAGSRRGPPAEARTLFREEVPPERLTPGEASAPHQLRSKG